MIYTVAAGYRKQSIIDQSSGNANEMEAISPMMNVIKEMNPTMSNAGNIRGLLLMRLGQLVNQDGR